jgi:hypothetical protein
MQLWALKKQAQLAVLIQRWVWRRWKLNQASQLRLGVRSLLLG